MCPEKKSAAGTARGLAALALTSETAPAATNSGRISPEPEFRGNLRTDAADAQGERQVGR